MMLCNCMVSSVLQKQNHPAKMPFEEDAATKDHEVRKKVKEAAAELEKAEGRGQLKVRRRSRKLWMRKRKHGRLLRCVGGGGKREHLSGAVDIDLILYGVFR